MKSFADSRLSVQFDDDLVQACRPGVVCVCDEVLPTPCADRRELLRLCTQPLAGILLTANGAPTRYDRDSGAPLAAFGPAAATLPAEWTRRGVVLDRDGDRILHERGIDTGAEATGNARRIGAWTLRRGADGGAFAVCDKGWTELDCREATPDPVPFRDIWRFFTGEDLPVRTRT